MTRARPDPRWLAVAAACLGALAGCGGRPAPREDPVLGAIGSDLDAGRAAFDRGEVGVALGQFERALARARAADDSAQIAVAGYNLAACWMALGRSGDAARLLADVTDAFERSGLYAGPAHLLAGWADRDRGERGASAKSAARAEAAALAARDVAIVCGAKLLQGHLAADDGDAAHARASLEQARQMLAPLASPSLAARAALLEGRILEIQGRLPEAAKAYEQECALLQEIRASRELPAALRRAGGAFAASGDIAKAAELHYRSARSAFGQGDAGGAREALERVRGLDQSRIPSDLGARVAALSSEVESASSGAPSGALR